MLPKGAGAFICSSDSICKHVTAVQMAFIWPSTLHLKRIGGCKKDGEKAPCTLEGPRGYLESSPWVLTTNRSLYWKCGKTNFSKFCLPLLFGPVQFNRNTKIKELCKPCFIVKLKKRIFLKWFIFPFFLFFFFFFNFPNKAEVCLWKEDGELQQSHENKEPTVSPVQACYHELIIPDFKQAEPLF